MGEYRLIAIADLLIDEVNPRLSTAKAGQRVSLRDMVEHGPEKLVRLAESIAQNGLNPIELPAVTPSTEKHGFYKVLEGSRRLCAVQILDSPNLLGAWVEPAIRTRFATASETYQQRNPPRDVLCHVMTRDEAHYWIRLRHTGENNGVGVASWSPLAQARFDRKSEPFQDILDRLTVEHLISANDAKTISATNFQRIVESAAARKYLGYSFVDGRFHPDAPWSTVSKAFVRIVNELKTGRLNVNRIRKAADITSYIKELFPNPSKPEANPPREPKQTKPSERPKKKRTTTAAARPTLIPDDSALRVTDARTHSVEIELRTLPLDKFPNATAVMLRVFLEFSMAHYIKANSIAVATAQHKNTFAQRLTDTITHMAANGLLDKNEARTVRSATQPNTLLATSVTTLNDYVHNPHWSPSPTELRASWDRLYPLFRSVWPVQ